MHSGRLGHVDALKKSPSLSQCHCLQASPSVLEQGPTEKEALQIQFESHELTV